MQPTEIEIKIKEQLATHGIVVSELTVPVENAESILAALESTPAPPAQ